MLKEEELQVVQKLAEAWNLYLLLPERNKNTDETTDFRKSIHDAQRIIMARSAVRSNPKNFSQNLVPNFKPFQVVNPEETQN